MDGRRLGQLAEDPFGGKPARTQTAAGEEEFNEEQTTNSDQLAPRLLGGAPRRSPVHESRSGARNEFGYAQSSHDPSEKRASPQLDEIPQPDEAIRVDEETRSPAKKKARVGEGIDEGASTSAGQTPSKSRAPNQNQDENPRRTHRTSFIKGNFLISRTPLTTNSDQLAPRLLGGAPRRSPVHESRSGARNEFGYAQSSHDPSEKRASPQLDEIPQPDEAIRVDEETRSPAKKKARVGEGIDEGASTSAGQTPSKSRAPNQNQDENPRRTHRTSFIKGNFLISRTPLTTNSDQLAPRLLGGAPRRSPVHESRSGARNEFGYAQSSHDPSEKRASPQLDEIPQPDEAIRVDEERRRQQEEWIRMANEQILRNEEILASGDTAASAEASLKSFWLLVHFLMIF